MALLINSKCINCDMCDPECPNQAIYMGEKIYEIDPNKCTECKGFHEEPQCAAVCPVDCCIDDEDIRETEEELLKKKDSLHLVDSL